MDAWGDQENVVDLVKFLIGLLGADPSIIRRNKKNATFKVLCNALQVCLGRDVPLSVKNEAFELIPMYITVPGDHIQQVKLPLHLLYFFFTFTRSNLNH